MQVCHKVSVEYSPLSPAAHHLLLNAIASLRIFTLAIVAALAISIGACSRQSDKDATPVLSGAPSTTFPVPPASARAEMGWILNDGKRARVGDYQGQVLVLDFYATWCEPCRKSIPRLIALQNKYGAKGLQVVGLNVGGPDDRIKVSNFGSELGIQYPLGFPDRALSDLFLSDNQTIPQTFVFGREGQLLKRFIGYDESTEVELEKVVQEAVSRKSKQPDEERR
jgi:thiol-disulfide isomerase/thioredoxin